MAATDKHYRDQNTLDIVFALSSIAMLVGLILMFMQDYNREYKVEQRVFRDVEVAVAQRAALTNLPDPKEFEEARKEVAHAKTDREAKEEKIKQLRSDIKARLPERDAKETQFQTIKADLESRGSFYDIEVEHHGVTEKASRYQKEIAELDAKLAEVKVDRDRIAAEIRDKQAQIDELEAPLVRATSKLKKLSDQFDAQVKTAASKQWGAADWFRSWPILDAFAPPTKIHQFAINDVPIDYNFKYVTRYDRCMTCHLGINRPEFTRENLLALRGVTNEQDRKLNEAIKLLRERKESLSGLPEQKQVPDPDALSIMTLDSDRLSDARVTEFCAHPRLDLYVGPTSKHPAEKFGCSSCHSGQGSSTSFVLASHTPNSSDQEKEWKHKYSWESNHMWDFPMLPKRFIESSCLKCHHEVTDLISSENRVEAPKLVQGFNTIQDVGCFGCHEIQGRKGGRSVGPDLRLESFPPLEDLTPGQRARIEGDPDNAPGKYRKVGPSLFRLKEKTHEEFVRKWIYAPREFRPDTKMPHYYGLSTNHKDVLPDDQKEFPNTEIYAITRFLFRASDDYLKELSERKKDSAEIKANDLAYQQHLIDFLESRATMTRERFDGKIDEETKKRISDGLVQVAERVSWSRLLESPLTGGKTFKTRIREALDTFSGKLPPDLNKDVTKLLDEELKLVTQRIKMREKTPLLVDHAKGMTGNEKRGRMLFSERGCQACHVHEGTATPQGTPGDKSYVPALIHDADFGPSLSQIVDKLGTKKGDAASARTWLVQWLLEPTVHSPRTRMPNTHLTTQDAADIAAWLLSFKQPLDTGDDWDKIDIQKPGMKQLSDLARVYLVRILARTDMDALLAGGTLPEGQIAELPAEEKWLALKYKDAANPGDAAAADKDSLREKALLEYLGRKAVNRLGCYGCHDIPGYENAKPIGVTLNDWGKKSPERLAFENIDTYLRNHYQVVDNLVGEDGKPIAPTGVGKAERETYEKFYADLLAHRTREGYLNQKLRDPRSYDYERRRAWDDRYRMPQFKFAKFRISPQAKTDRALQKTLQKFLAVRPKLTLNELNSFLEGLPPLPVLDPLRKEIDEIAPLLLEESQGEVDKLLSEMKLSPKNQERLDRLFSNVQSQLSQVNARIPTAGQVKGQALLAEANAREAVATFILGLVAEPVPLHSINQLKGDRLAEVRGRQILEKFNCNSCHLVRPGYFEFKSSPENKKYLDKTHDNYVKSAKGSYRHPEHYYWTGEDPRNGTVKALVNWPAVSPDGKTSYPLLEALRFQGTDRTLYDIGTLTSLSIGGDFGLRVQDMVTPPPSVFSSPDGLNQYLQTHGPFGGTFGEALAQYLMEKTKKDASPLGYSNARSSTPPFLTAQGEKTQPEWLYQFLLNPGEIRKMVILRMPRFNLSQDDSRALVEYFSAVERINNPGIGLTAPYETIKQQDGLNSEFWKEKNRHYVERLKSTYIKGPDGKATKTTFFDRRREELKPFWEQAVEDHVGRRQNAQRRVAQAQTEFDAVNKDYEPLAKDVEALKKEAQAKKDAFEADEKKKSDYEAAQAKYEAKLAELNKIKPGWENKGRTLDSWKAELDGLTKDDAKMTLKEMEANWTNQQAYLSDSFRLLFHKQLCSQCHQVGERETPASTPGPNLTMAHKRLRPGWLERWVTDPRYYLHYTPMPVNFIKGAESYQELFVGSSYDQIQAVRDVLMVYPQVAEQPLSRYWVLPPAPRKTEEKGKTGEK